MPRPPSLSELLGGRLASALDDARGILQELVERGRLPREEAMRLENEVKEALERARDVATREVVQPLRAAFGEASEALARVRRSASAGGGDRGPEPSPAASLADRLDDLAARIERVERLLGLDGREAP